MKFVWNAFVVGVVAMLLAAVIHTCTMSAAKYLHWSLWFIEAVAVGALMTLRRSNG